MKMVMQQTQPRPAPTPDDAQYPPALDTPKEPQQTATMPPQEMRQEPPQAQAFHPERLDRADQRRTSASRRGIIGGGLVALGLLLLVGTLTDSTLVGMLFLLLLGLFFLTWGAAAHQVGFLIPGSILSGLGLGVFIIQVVMPQAPEPTRGGIVVLGLALGFLAITPVARLLTPSVHYWPLIPGAILAFIGVSLVIGGAALDVLEVFGTYLWSVVLIVIGAFLLWRGYAGRRQRDR